MFLSSLMAVAALVAPAPAQKSANPFEGRWDFNIATPGGTRACWLGVTAKGGTLEVWYQPPGGNVYQLKDVKLDGSHLILTVSRSTTWDLEASGGQLTGVQKSGEHTIQLTGVRAPELKRSAPAAWTDPEPLFNGKDLTGWEPIGPAASHWKVEDGLLVNTAHGANLKSTRKFEDFQGALRSELSRRRQ
jgi:hypothetical protein